jgi:hypothetical protein
MMTTLSTDLRSSLGIPRPQTDSPNDKIPPGTSFKMSNCFEVPKDATKGMELVANDRGWGKQKAWKVEADL